MPSYDASALDTSALLARYEKALSDEKTLATNVGIYAQNFADQFNNGDLGTLALEIRQEISVPPDCEGETLDAAQEVVDQLNLYGDINADGLVKTSNKAYTSYQVLSDLYQK